MLMGAHRLEVVDRPVRADRHALARLDPARGGALEVVIRAVLSVLSATEVSMDRNAPRSEEMRDTRKGPQDNLSRSQVGSERGFGDREVPQGQIKSLPDIDHIFTYHAPNAIQQEKYEEIRDGARQFGHLLTQTCPAGADLSAAIRLLRECVMTANASIALDGRT